MPKAILEFNLPEDENEFIFAKNGIKYSIVLDDLDNWLRGKTKYEDIDTITIDEVRSKMKLLMEEYDL